jgi:hypothetical protein
LRGNWGQEWDIPNFHVRGVDVFAHVGDAGRITAEAHGPAVDDLCRQLEAGRPHGLLPGMERTVATLVREVDFRALGQEDTPRGLEGNACLVEGLGYAASVL